MNNLPNYIELNEVLEKTESSFDASQVHGFICGLIASQNTNSDWENQIIGPKSNKQSCAFLQELYESCSQLLSEFSFEFSLILPSDEIDIKTRTESLGLWCQGFVIGFQQTHPHIVNQLSEEVKDSFADLIEIAKVDFDDVVENEEDETAYFELTEHVRLAVLMIAQELSGTLH